MIANLNTRVPPHQQQESNADYPCIWIPGYGGTYHRDDATVASQRNLAGKRRWLSIT